MKTLFFIISLLASSTCFAQIAIAKGEPCPEDGLFLTKEQAAKVIAEKKASEEICKINQNAATEESKAKCEYEKGLLKNELSYEKTKFIEISKLRDVQDQNLYERIGDSGDNLYWFAGGIVAGAATAAAVSISIVLIINQVNP